MFDPATGAWSALPPLPSARGGLTAGVFGGKLHVVGGATVSPMRTYGELSVLDLARRSWTRGPSLPTPRQALASAFAAGRWWVIGGGAGAGVFGVFTTSDAVEAYTP
jgi:non-specific serine/threonine protein kinase